METKIKSKTKQVFQCGQSLVIILPRDFCRRADIRKGDTVGIVYNDSALTVVSPRKPKEEPRKALKWLRDYCGELKEE